MFSAMGHHSAVTSLNQLPFHLFWKFATLRRHLWVQAFVAACCQILFQMLKAEQKAVWALSAALDSNASYEFLVA